MVFLSASNTSLHRQPPTPRQFAKHPISSGAQTPTVPAESLPAAVALCWQVLTQ